MAELEDPAADLAGLGDLEVEDEAAVEAFLEAGRGVPAALADPAGLAGGEADGDGNGLLSFLDAEGVGHVLLEVEGLGDVVAVGGECGALDAVEGEDADLAPELVPGGEVPVAAVVEDVVRVDAALAQAVAAEALVADEELSAEALRGEDVAEDGGFGCVERAGIAGEELVEARRRDLNLFR